MIETDEMTKKVVTFCSTRFNFFIAIFFCFFLKKYDLVEIDSIGFLGIGPTPIGC